MQTIPCECGRIVSALPPAPTARCVCGRQHQAGPWCTQKGCDQLGTPIKKPSVTGKASSIVLCADHLARLKGGPMPRTPVQITVEVRETDDALERLIAIEAELRHA